MGRRYPYDILLAGIGIGGPHNTTLATVELLKKARIAFNLSVHDAYVRTVCRRVIDLDEEYYSGEEDYTVYRRLARRVMNEAGRGGGVAVIDDGHPLIFDDVNTMIVRHGKRRGLRVTVLPAVSSLDVVLAQSHWNLGAGSQIVEATHLVRYRQRLNPAFDTLVMQLGWFGVSQLVRIEPTTRERFRPLQRYLLRFYPPGHRVRIVRASQSPRDKGVALSCRLDRLVHQYRRIETDSTLLVPALE